MSLTLKPNEACKYGNTCPYNNHTGLNFCIGANSQRPGPFVCELISDTGVFTEGGFRSKFDETGKMKVIVEGAKNE